jgi:hypothetical protein
MPTTHSYRSWLEQRISIKVSGERGCQCARLLTISITLRDKKDKIAVI